MEEKITPFMKLIAGDASLIIVAPPAEPAPVLDAQERELANYLVENTQKFGKFDQDGDGVWAGYKPAAMNNKKSIGVKCANCVLWEGGSSCKIIALPVEPEGKCRFAVIPEGVVRPKVES
jgi:hypothetical protein